MKFESTRLRIFLLAALWLVLLGPASAVAEQWRWSGVERIVAVGDVHGAFDELTGTLKKAGIIDADLRWSGGAAHFVSMGDLVDRGARSREVLDLMIRLQSEAAAAGGAVHVLLGNHEAMRVTGELKHVIDAEYAAFRQEEDPATRQLAYERFLQRESRSDTEAAKADFLERHPPGFFGFQAAFSPTGQYGAWILQRPVIIVINDTLFVHGGLVDSLAEGSLETLNSQYQTDLGIYAASLQALLQAGALDIGVPFPERAGDAAAAAAADPSLVEWSEGLKLSGRSPLFIADGPLWYRGTAWCNPNVEVIRTDRVLTHLGAKRVVLGHTPTIDSRIIQRMDERVFMIDTGMLEEVYKGRPAAFLQGSGSISALYLDEGSAVPVTAEPRRVGPRADRLTDGQIEDILTNGKIESIEDVGQGVTKPQKVAITQGDHKIEAIFKTESTPIQASSRRQAQKLINLSDRWEHEVAAYRLDRLIGLDLVPVTVERTINGRRGSLSFWIDGLISELDRETKEVPASGWCSLSEQWPMMFVFDALIYNEDRTKQNMVYGEEDWMMYLIDHSRSFRTQKGRPKDIRNVELKLSPLLAGRLEKLEYTDLSQAMSGLLEKSQIQALIRRRDEILKDWRKSL
ncbi:MAG: metallophosphoesterase [Gammaproteobacteria bacterium]|nr:MAG: metallophosphoesterase [Gammaproteobacteria bacterium]